MRRRHAAFTLIEMITVIAIISILTALLIMGVGKMSRTMKEKATAADLENIQSLFDEMNAHGGMSTAPVNWLWRNQTVAGGVATAGGTVNFWKIPYTVSFTPGVVLSDAFSAEGSIADTDGTGMELLRNGSKAVLNTQLAMRILLSYPANKTAVAKLPADRLFIPNWVSGNIPASGQDGIGGTTDDSSDLSNLVVYAVNNCVRYQGSTFRCTAANYGQAPPAPTTGANPPAYNNYWIQDADPTPLILDGWGNPLIIVPATGLVNVRGNVGTSNGTTSGTTITIVNGSPSSVTSQLVPYPSEPYARTLPPIQSPDNRPFFVSAGPDGDLTTGDDNVYSFSK